MSDQLEGLSAISVELARIWRIPSVAEWNVCKYMARSSDPLPYRKIVGRIYADVLELQQWAERQVKRQPPQPPQNDQPRPAQQTTRSPRTAQPVRSSQAQQSKRTATPSRIKQRK